MKLQINDREVELPHSLEQITLGQRIDFHNQYGRDFEIRIAAITEMPSGIDRTFEEAQFAVEKALATFAFFAGLDLEAVKESESLEEILIIHNACLEGLLKEESEVDLKGVYEFAGAVWELHPPALSSASKMTFGEFVDSKQIVKHLLELSTGKWESLVYLCAIYLRKEGEPYSEELVHEGSDRLDLMRTLPMDIALEVGFFLSASMSSYLNLSASLPMPEGPLLAKT